MSPLKEKPRSGKAHGARAKKLAVSIDDLDLSNKYTDYFAVLRDWLGGSITPRDYRAYSELVKHCLPVVAGAQGAYHE